MNDHRGLSESMTDLTLELPHFIVIGAAKAGTTALHSLLDQHPNIYMPKEKELHFFDRDEEYAQGISHYVRQFRSAEVSAIRGEATPSYLRNPEVPRRISGVYREKAPRLVVILRDPVERAWSHYLHQIRLAKETASFEDALLIERERLRENPGAWSGYFTDGLYAHQLQIWLRYFPRSNFHFILAEELGREPSVAVSSVFSFLGVDPTFVPSPGLARLRGTAGGNVAATARSPAFMRWITTPSSVGRSLGRLLPPRLRRELRLFLIELNLRPYASKPIMNVSTRQRLRAAYRADVTALQSITGLDLGHWLSECQ